MASLSSIISDAGKQFKNQIGESKRDVRSTASAALSTAKKDVTGIIPAITQNAGAAITSAGRDAIGAGRTAISNAASSIVKGDIRGALESLTSGPGAVIASLGSSFGQSTLGTLLGATKQGPQPGNSLAGALARPDPLLSFCWYCIMPDVTPMGGAPTSLPWYFVEEISPTFRQMKNKTVYFAGHDKHFIESYSVDALRATLYADSQGIALNYLNAWQGAMIRPTTAKTASQRSGGFGRAKDYKKTISVYMLDVTKAQVARIDYVGCYPIGLDGYNLDSNSSTRILNQLQFSVDDVFITVFNVKNAVQEPLLKRLAKEAVNEGIAQVRSALPSFSLPSFT